MLVHRFDQGMYALETVSVSMIVHLNFEGELLSSAFDEADEYTIPI